MNILIVEKCVIPVKLYGGTERVIWALGKELAKLGHNVTYLVNEGSSSNFASIININNNESIIKQIPNDIDVVHFNFFPKDIDQLNIPYIITVHGNVEDPNALLDKNCVFVSKNHAERHSSDSYVYNGLDWSEYSTPNLNTNKNYFHFLGKASWGVKNLKGAIDVIKATKSERLAVLGGKRFSERVIKMGPSHVLSTRINFKGMVGGKTKEQLLNHSKGLLFPVVWHEPFGLAIIESLFYGCPIFGTPYGSLKELITDDVGFLSTKKNELAMALENSSKYSVKKCHEYALDMFNSKNMALAYVKKYEHVINGAALNNSLPRLKNIQKEKYLAFS